jgi:hypothetical protein
VQFRFRQLTNECIGLAFYSSGHKCDCRFLGEDLRESEG